MATAEKTFFNDGEKHNVSYNKNEYLHELLNINNAVSTMHILQITQACYSKYSKYQPRDKLMAAKTCQMLEVVTMEV